jgi:hypothetical protein
MIGKVLISATILAAATVLACCAAKAALAHSGMSDYGYEVEYIGAQYKISGVLSAAVGIALAAGVVLFVARRR